MAVQAAVNEEIVSIFGLFCDYDAGIGGELKQVLAGQHPEVSNFNAKRRRLSAAWSE